jgi:hypothetical protein
MDLQDRAKESDHYAARMNLNIIEIQVLYCYETEVPPDDTEAEDSFFLEWSSVQTERRPEFDKGSRAPTW